ncbi:hypothetical protein PHYPSEUDO_004842 [Phytophthora pseudosyringae]|uniref:Uncharacterized protein n=1 Tax=Phytophthora pseudosyringae TaxID=221518 RepID=A0A8T1VMA4_9STRA|nr:hypothetical protein PHYPSEUDO_004842 [Phytophthora pseudosyringae]
MGSTWSSSGFLSSSPPPAQLQTKDVLALGEDGDLLLAREKLADAALRVGVEFVVARDIRRMQCGQFPSQRVTSLPRTLNGVVLCFWFIEADTFCASIYLHPAWTSCELLLRHEGALHVVSVGANGLQFVPFEERVASTMPHVHDRVAVRRLRYEARGESLSTALRELATQVASVAPVSWQTLLSPTARTNMPPRSPRQQPVDHEAVVDALKELPPLIRQLLKRVMGGLKLDTTRTASKSLDKQQTTESVSTSSPRDKTPHASKAEEHDAGAELRDAMEVLGAAEVTARLSAAFVAAVYEHVHVLDPIAASKSDPLLPAAFWSSCIGSERLVFSPPTAFGAEMALARPTAHASKQNTYSLAK